MSLSKSVDEHHVNLSHTTIETLMINSCRFKKLTLPSTIKHLYINDLSLAPDCELGLSHLSPETLDIKSFRGEVTLPNDTMRLAFLRLQMDDRNIASKLMARQFPELTFLDILFNVERIPTDLPVLQHLNNMPKLKTLCCDCGVLSPVANIRGVEQLVLRAFDPDELPEHPIVTKFPDVTKMNLVLWEDIDTTNLELPPNLTTLVLHGYNHIPHHDRYWNERESVPRLENLVVYMYWDVEMGDDDLDWDISLPRVPYVRIGASDQIVFAKNEHLEGQYQLDMRTAPDEVAALLNMDRAQYDFHMIENRLKFLHSESDPLLFKSDWLTVRPVSISRFSYHPVTVPYKTLSFLFSPDQVEKLHYTVLEHVTNEEVILLLKSSDEEFDRFLEKLVWKIARRVSELDSSVEYDPRIVWAMVDMVMNILKANMNFLYQRLNGRQTPMVLVSIQPYPPASVGATFL
jgi:hypothetical protein